MLSSPPFTAAAGVAGVLLTAALDDDVDGRFLFAQLAALAAAYDARPSSYAHSPDLI